QPCSRWRPVKWIAKLPRQLSSLNLSALHSSVIRFGFEREFESEKLRRYESPTTNDKRLRLMKSLDEYLRRCRTGARPPLRGRSRRHAHGDAQTSETRHRRRSR